MVAAQTQSPFWMARFQPLLTRVIYLRNAIYRATPIWRRTEA